MAAPPRDTFEIEDVRVLEVINNPLRLRILNELAGEAMTARELAEHLDVPVTRLYYHLDLLEEVTVVDVVDVRKSGARLQRVYQAVATHFTAGRRLLDGITDQRRLAETAAGVVLDGARLDAVPGLLRHFELLGESVPEEDIPGTLGRSMIRLTREGAVDITKRIGELVEDMSAMEDRSGEEYAFSFVFFPMAAPVRGESL